MKKFFALLLALTMVLALAACGTEPKPTEPTNAPTNAPTDAPTDAPTEAPTNAPTDAPTEPAVKVMTHEEFVAAEMESAVVIETYVQAVESWWDGCVQIYAQSEDGGYYIYDLACTEEDAAKLVPGTKIRVSGFKSEWSGEVEIIDATYEIIEGSYIVTEALDVTALLGTDELIKHQNELVAMKGLTVSASKDAEGNDVAFLYKWDGSGSQGDDIYFNVTLGENTYTFTVNAYMVDNAEAYAAVEALEIGDVIDIEGFLYWYNGAQPHVTAVSAAAAVMTHEEYVAAELDTAVVIETYVQAVESWWDGCVQIYAQSEDGGYYIYDLACTEEDAAKLVPGTKIRVSGFKSEWSGEVEIIDATYEIIEGSYIVTEALDVTALLGTDELIKHQNELVAMKGLTVSASKDAEGNDVAFLYKWDGSGSQGDDIYFNVTLGENTYTFTVNAYMVDNAEAYAAVEALEIGDVIDIEGFLYWYNGAQPHVTAVTPAA